MRLLWLKIYASAAEDSAAPSGVQDSAAAALAYEDGTGTVEAENDGAVGIRRSSAWAVSSAPRRVAPWTGAPVDSVELEEELLTIPEGLAPPPRLAASRVVARGRRN